MTPKLLNTFYNGRLLKKGHFCSISSKAIILTTGIQGVFRGLKFEPDEEMGQKGVIGKGLEG
jgi:hypothetical protein